LATYKSGAKVTGTATVGKTLTAKAGVWTGTSKITYSYQWYVCTKSIKAVIKNGKLPAGCSIISKATKSSLKLTTKQKKTYVAVLITARNSAGSSRLLTKSTGQIK
jgi:hypothetical protein